MERIKTIETRNLCESAKNGGCGECQTSCQSACKPAAAWPTRSARIRITILGNKSCRLFPGGSFYVAA